MQGNSCSYTLRVRPALFLFAVAMILGVGFFEVTQPPATGRPNNPQDFYLWTTNSSFAHTFRYDPRAADIWLFKAGGAARFNLDDVFELSASRTNR